MTSALRRPSFPSAQDRPAWNVKQTPHATPALTHLNSQHPYSVSPSCSVLTSVSGASLIQLRMSTLASAARGSGCESLSQLQRISYVTLLSVYIQSYLSSCSRSLCGQKRQLCCCWAFFSPLCSTLTINHFGESRNGISNSWCVLAHRWSCCTVTTGV